LVLLSGTAIFWVLSALKWDCIGVKAI